LILLPLILDLGKLPAHSALFILPSLFRVTSRISVDPFHEVRPYLFFPFSLELEIGVVAGY